MRPTTANLATHASRVERIRPTIDSLIGQVDVVRVWLNDCDPPSWVDEVPVVWHRGEDRTDMGKFGFLREGGYYFSCDDDLIYPPDYVGRTIAQMGAVLSYHGRVFRRFPIRNIYAGEAHRYDRANAAQFALTIAGTGVTCIDTSKFMPSFTGHEEPMMADVHLALACNRAGVVPMMGVKPKGWIKGVVLDAGIYGIMSRRASVPTEVFNRGWV